MRGMGGPKAALDMGGLVLHRARGEIMQLLMRHRCAQFPSHGEIRPMLCGGHEPLLRA
jgi:hypothetical protein